MMLRSFSLLVSAALALLYAGVVDAYADPQLCTGICVNSHDPSIIRRDDGTYFRFSTGNEISVHTAPDLTGPWSYKGSVLPGGSKIKLPGNTDLWAPDVHKVGNTYYLYYSVSTFGSQSSAIGLARSTSMDIGTWTDFGSTGVVSSPSKAYNAIDPNLLQVGNNSYLNFGSSWGGIYQAAMKSNPTNTNSKITHLATSSDGEVIEGSFIFKNGNYYYLFFSMGSCCGYNKNRPAPGKEYRIMVCRSSSPNGGFVDKNGVACTNGGGSVVLASHGWVYGPGGQGVYQDPTYGPVLYYHYVDTRIGYADGDKHLGWNQIDFSSGWPVV